MSKERINGDGDRLIKSVVIARSGVYNYGRAELNCLRLTNVPERYAGRSDFNVYRPAVVLEKYKDLFMCLPVTILHPQGNVVSKNNAKQLQEGLTGENVTIEYDDKGEALIKTTITLTTDRAIRIYENGYKEVSPGYDALFEWLPEPLTYDGKEYQIVMKEVYDATHLALVPVGRGGSRVRIVDHMQGENHMRFLTNLFYRLNKKAGKVCDSASMTDRLKAAVGDTAVSVIEEIKGTISYLPESDGKKRLGHYLDDFLAVGDSAPDLKEAAIGEIVTLFNELDAEAIGDSAEEKPAEKEKAGDSEKDTDDTPSVSTPTGDYQPGTTGQAGSQGEEEEKTAVGDSGTTPQMEAATFMAAAFFNEMEARGMVNAKRTAVGDSGLPTAIISEADTKNNLSTSEFFKGLFGGN